MKDIIKLGLILLLVTAIAGAALSLVNNVTKPRIEEQKRLVTERALIAALPEADKNHIAPVIENDTIRYYIGYKDSMKQEITGYAFVAKQYGYSSEIQTMVGVDSLGKVIGLKVIQQVETPGLGTKIELIPYGDSLSWAQKQIIGKMSDELAVDKDGGQITSITGATISSRAVVNSIKNGLEMLNKQLVKSNAENK
jgi:electron transport complex protein RnfG